jgi:hypothetical protein
VSWIPEDLAPPAAPAAPCIVLKDPDKDHLRCGRPATGGHTILDWGLCDECWEAIRL